MEKLTFQIDDQTKRYFLSQLALQKRTVKSVLTDAVRFWFPLVSAARDVVDEIAAAAVEGTIAAEQFDTAVRTLKEVLQEIDDE